MKSKFYLLVFWIFISSCEGENDLFEGTWLPREPSSSSYDSIVIRYSADKFTVNEFRNKRRSGVATRSDVYLNVSYDDGKTQSIFYDAYVHELMISGERFIR